MGLTLPGEICKRREHMTHLELMAEIGSGPVEIVKLYFEGRITAMELESVLGKEKAMLVAHFYIEHLAMGC